MSQKILYILSQVIIFYIYIKAQVEVNPQINMMDGERYGQIYLLILAGVGSGINASIYASVNSFLSLLMLGVRMAI